MHGILYNSRQIGRIAGCCCCCCCCSCCCCSHDADANCCCPCYCRRHRCCCYKSWKASRQLASLQKLMLVKPTQRLEIGHLFEHAIWSDGRLASLETDEILLLIAVMLDLWKETQADDANSLNKNWSGVGQDAPLGMFTVTAIPVGEQNPQGRVCRRVWTSTRYWQSIVMLRREFEPTVRWWAASIVAPCCVGLCCVDLYVCVGLCCVGLCLRRPMFASA